MTHKVMLRWKHSFTWVPTWWMIQSLVVEKSDFEANVVFNALLGALTTRDVSSGEELFANYNR